MMGPKSRRVVSKREFRVSADELYEAWTDPETMKLWLAPHANVVTHVESDVRVGGCVHIRSHSPDGNEHMIHGVFRELVRPRRIVMTWTYEGPFALICKVQTLIEIDLAALAKSRTQMHFVQSQLDTDEIAQAYESDWPSCFDKLEKTLAPTIAQTK